MFPPQKLWQKALKQFPCILITGPKHPEKVNFIREFAGAKYQVINLEDPEVRAKADKSPESILAKDSGYYLIEEVQHSPQITEVIKNKILQNPEQMGHFIFTSSFSIKILNCITDHLSGLTAILHYVPTCWNSNIENQLSPIDCKIKNMEAKKESDLFDIFRQGYSNTIEGKKDRYYGNWLQIYMERDLPRIRNIENISDFQYFLKKLTDYNAGPLNMAELARTLGLSLNTVKAWVSVLQESFIITLIKPFRKNYGIRLKKTPNIYFQDPGLVTYLCEITDNKALKKHPKLIGIMMSLVVNELYRWYHHSENQPPIYLWNPSDEEESVLVLETVKNIYLFDVSLKAKQNLREFSFFQNLRNIYGDKLVIYNLHLENTTQTIDKNIHSIPISWLEAW
jgi:predicted AAA+ superfamily ATPase